MIERAILNYYTKPGVMTSVGKKYNDLIKKLPTDVKKLTRIVQGLAIHQYVASPFYGVEILGERQSESHIRYAKQLLDAIFPINDAPLATMREPKDRLFGVCYHFAKLLVAFLRAKGIPSRMRYGFGDYFNPGFYEDHSLCEYWDAKEGRWVLVDPQFDSVWQRELNIAHDVFDVPRNRFLVAGDAWVKCRSGEADPGTFGIFQGNMRGLWFIARNIVKDVAALNKMEMLQWDAWTGMPRPNNKMQDKKKLKLFDQLATLTHEPGASFKELRKLHEDKDNHLDVPDRVFNAMRRHLEKI